ncbi:hypothetical protein J5J10_12100 [Ciceribacter sp. L1K23]|uniref:hypothetical protein n=1 Tax=unclassified Ciceribacter TaxID=2628820 RepID=UPI001ABDA53C|nr:MULTISPECIES: hypothetical protein [unclassified Ciceribacter]MBO3759293.1 hypothetical protein [Ciceribacter sp. L1K22]MBR0556422.1 hypothetical protein [Ciceribacter sp. L1K23]
MAGSVKAVLGAFRHLPDAPQLCSASRGFSSLNFAGMGTILMFARLPLLSSPPMFPVTIDRIPLPKGD